MDKQPAIAELRFADQGLSLYGTVMRMSAQDITVRLFTVPVSRDIFTPDNRVELVVVARDNMFSAATQIAGIEKDNLRLLFAAPVRSVQQRKEQRIPMELGVSFRPIQDDGCFGSWKSGGTKDISSGGMGLVVGPGIAVPGKLEILFILPTHNVDMAQEAETSGDDPTNPYKMQGENRVPSLDPPTRIRPIKATARVSNRRTGPHGHSILGLTFITLSPPDRIRMAKFLNAHR